jgi:hypothetical protein
MVKTGADTKSEGQQCEGQQLQFRYALRHGGA